MDVSVNVNGTRYERDVEPRKLLIHFLRDDLDLTGSHVGCDTGNCGACSVIFDGTLVKSCMLLAVQANGASVETVEGLAEGEELTPLQQAQVVPASVRRRKSPWPPVWVMPWPAMKRRGPTRWPLSTASRMPICGSPKVKAPN